MELSGYIEKIKVEYKESFDKFSNLLIENNKKFNLTAICDEEGIFIRHFVDSLAGEKFFAEGASVAEIGSGGGFPSIPLKIVRSDLKFTLIESTGKKCTHLNEAAATLNLSGVEVLCKRAEDASREERYREKFDVCEARAVARLATLCEYCMPFVKVGGRFIAYKGECDEEVSEAAKAIKVLGGTLEHVEKYELPNGEKRSLVIIKKTAHTPPKYPRGQGKERKSPII